MNNQDRLYVDIHVLQIVPPSCINRDDTGSPKTAVYGGATRARVSSQSWKRAMRLMFGEMFSSEALGVRTKRIVEMVANELQELGAADPEKLAIAVLEAAGLKIKSAEKGTDALFFISIAQAKALARLAADNAGRFKNPSKEEKQAAQQALRQNPGVDIALFGRMVADDPSLNTDACAQVAHSISTHRVSTEYDYFTAVDDRAPEDSAGAGHIGTVEFNAATLYRYATIAVHELYKHLQDDTPEAVEKFADAFVRSMPTGKQNTFANRTLPDAVLITLRTDQPVNLVGAFEKPVPPSDEGYATASAVRLATHAQSVYANFAGEPELSLVIGESLSTLADPLPLPKVLAQLGEAIRSHVGEGGDAQ